MATITEEMTELVELFGRGRTKELEQAEASAKELTKLLGNIISDRHKSIHKSEEDRLMKATRLVNNIRQIVLSTP